MTAKSDMQVDASDYDSRTGLHVAASEGHMNVIRLLVERYNARHNLQDRYGGTPLDDAIQHRQSQAIEYLVALRSQGKVCLQPERYVEKLIQAAAEDDVEYVKMLIGAGMDPNVADNYNRTPLHLAASRSSMHVLEYLVDHDGIQLGPLDMMGNTPLWDAIWLGDHKAATILRSRGAPVQPNLSSSLCTAAARNSSRFFELLLVHNIDTSSTVRALQVYMNRVCTCIQNLPPTT